MNESIMQDNIIQLKDLHYHYPDGTHALKGITITIPKGQVTALLGGNGAGKSTLFQHLNGILKPSSGEVFFDGQPVDYSRKGLLNLRQAVGMVFQDPDNQLFSASVYQDVSYGVLNLQLPKDEAQRRVEHALERTGISHLRNKPTHALSFGQKKRAAIAGVLAMEPQVLVLDEPTAGLDPKGISEIMQLLLETQKGMDLTILIATHDIDIVPLYCDRVFVMDEGEVVLEGTCGEVFAKREKLRNVNLRLPRIGHLMEILKFKDGFALDEIPMTISGARKALKNWRDEKA
ncbi:cobalt transport protein ATP-binding subunit [Desulfitobacterium dehalogenans ATCC 51507]|uniref:ABC transporter ATP-binding protein n=2 Tax=Desulfitobacterium dehalogenans TaxID=36854 RepID=I4A930_DESDJ|nr:cobalt transport protein ATP-binding subunit [Desulfitobacterium dehalogenans ATCC 51507]